MSALLLLLLLALLVGTAQAGVAPPLECSSAAEQPNWPIFHPMNNVTRDPKSGQLVMEKLNDANAVGFYRGIYHVMMQEGGGRWSHMVSNDLVRWHHVQDSLPDGVNMSFPDRGPCDGSMSFPDLGAAPYNGSTPLIVYDADCGAPLPANETPPSGPHSKRKVPGDVARLEVARPTDPTDPYLRAWTKTLPGPVKFSGVPCAFPSDVWRSANGSYWNMLCDVDGLQPWARYTSTDPSLMTWALADRSFTVPPVGCYDCTQTGIMWQPIPNPAPGGPTHLINGNYSMGTRGRHDAFYLGKYDSKQEKFMIDMELGPQIIESGLSGFGFPVGEASWAVAGRGDQGRLLSIGWVSMASCHSFGGCGANVASLVRELMWDNASRQLVQRPVAEYASLHNATFLDAKTVHLLASRRPLTLPIPRGQGGSMDLALSFELSDLRGAAGPFGVAVRAPSNWNGTDTAHDDSTETPPVITAASPLVLQFNVSAPDAKGTRLVTSFGVKAALPVFKVLEGERLDVQMLMDRPLTETFLQGGRAVFAEAGIPFSLEHTAVHLFNYGTVPITASDISLHQMACGWTAELPSPKAAVKL